MGRGLNPLSCHTSRPAQGGEAGGLRLGEVYSIALELLASQWADTTTRKSQDRQDRQDRQVLRVAVLPETVAALAAATAASMAGDRHQVHSVTA